MGGSRLTEMIMMMSEMSTKPARRSFAWPSWASSALSVTGLVLASLTVNAQEVKKNPLLQEDFPFQGACISATGFGKNTAMKGLAIRVGNGESVLFDTELLRYASGWTGKFITTFGVAFDGGHGGHPKIDGDQKFGTPMVPGWVVTGEAFKDPRAEPYGALPAAVQRWDGLYVSGMDTILTYTVAGTKIVEQPGSVAEGGQVGFVRSFALGKVAKPLTLLVAEVEGGQGKVDGATATVTAGDKTTVVVATGLPKGAQLKTEGGRVLVSFAKGNKGAFNLMIWNGAAADAPAATGLGKAAASKKVVASYTKGGVSRWPESVKVKGQLATSKTPDGAYVTDSLTAPLDNPWKRRVRFSGLDFFKDGKRAALSSWDGDVWIVSGIDDKLENLQWHRYASGMYETIGLKIVNDVIYTSGRDQITRYHDLNNDGEADYYENFNNEYTSSEGFHEFLFDLQTDRKGNFYFAKASPVNPGGRGFEHIAANAGTLMKVSKGGKKLDVVATGFRAPNGIGINPWNDQITTCDNEGSWMPSCPINWVKPGGFYGVENSAHKSPIPPFNPPMLWLSHNGWDNSGGGQVWVNSDKWGPFKGELLHASYGECAIYLIMKQQVGEQMQAGAVRIPVKFTSSSMRPKFNPIDGQLYVAGLQGWQTKAVKLAGLDRVRYTGAPVRSVSGLKIDKHGVHLSFTQALDAKEATDAQNYSAEMWNYRRSSDYGSPEVSVKDPKKVGHDKLEVKAATLSADGKTVTLTIPDLTPAMQAQIKFSIKSKDGGSIDQVVQNTIHAIP